MQVLGYWADDWKSHPIKWITPITNQPQMRAGQGGRWQALARWHRKDGWCTPCQVWEDDWEENEGPAYLSIFLPLSGIWDTCHLCLHLSIITKSYFLSWLMLVALSPSILLKFSSSLPFVFLACSQSTDIFPLAANCEHRPHPLYQGFCFYSEMASKWRRCSVPRGSFSHSQAGITLTGQEEFIIQWSISQPMPREY